MTQEIVFLEEIKQNELMSKKHKKVWTTLNYLEHFLNFASTITGCISISASASYELCNGIKDICNKCRN